MTDAECRLAIQNGMALVKKLPGNALLLGEMGIGNTSCASLLLARLANIDVASVSGMGTGLDAEGVRRKVEVLRAVLDLHAGVTEPLAVLAAMGGLEVATMVGAVLQAAAERRVILVDGFITSAAVLVASRLCPAVLERCVYAHRSGERGHTLMLLELGPSRCWTGICAWVKARVRPRPGRCWWRPAVLREMASFSTAGVSVKSA
jgi:nicotinate-nucleotide--dimethylbenzimidazole phosphoribosyltransferase